MIKYESFLTINLRDSQVNDSKEISMGSKNRTKISFQTECRIRKGHTKVYQGFSTLLTRQNYWQEKFLSCRERFFYYCGIDFMEKITTKFSKKNHYCGENYSKKSLSLKYSFFCTFFFEKKKIYIYIYIFVVVIFWLNKKNQ